MKTKTLKLNVLSIAAFAAILLIACNKSADDPYAGKPITLEQNLMLDKSLFARSLKERDAKEVFEIKEIIRKNEMLEVKVKGGGNAESFQFIWDGLVQESYPVGIRLVMKYNNSDQDFDANKEMTVTLNLQKIVGERQNVKDYHFNIINGSKLQTKTLNPDGSTSDQAK